MAGDERIFVDAQWLRFFDEDRKWSLFSRTRATTDYDEKTDLFTGSYLNYTTSIGLGGSLVGKVANSGAGVDGGLHVFKSKPSWTLFGLASVGLQKELEYSWFSIFRFTPQLNEKLKLYSSLELFTLMNDAGNVVSVQRIRLGIDRKGFQFGLANNSTKWASSTLLDNNFGGFIRKSF